MLVIPMDDTSPSRGRFMYIMFMFLLFMMFSPNPPNPYRMMALEALAAREKHSLEVIKNATYIGPFEIPQSLNLTGANFSIPEYVQRSVNSLSQNLGDEEVAYYSNITGIVRGQWHRIPKPDPDSRLPSAIPDDNDLSFPSSFSAPAEWGNFTYRDNIVGNLGKFSLDLSERHKNSTIQFVEGVLYIGKASGENMFDTKLQGVHFPATGEVVLVSTTPRKFDGIPFIPFLNGNNDTFELAKELITARLEESIEQHTSYISHDDSETNYFPPPIQCDMIIFLSVVPLSGITPESLALYENEMRYPTGQTVVKPAAMELSGVMYSPDCGTALEWREERAVKAENFWQAGRVVGIVAGLIAGVQVLWVLKEMAERGSPSSVSKVSFWTVAMQALMSGYLCGIYLVTAIVLENITVPFLATTFMAFILMLYELRFLGLIFRVQRPERPINRPPRPTPLGLIRRGNGTPQNTPANTALNTPAPNTPATATVLPTPENTSPARPAPPPPPPPVIEEQREPDTRSEYFIITKYFYVSVLALFILTSWLSAHSVLMKILLLALHSFWVPQVYRNVMRGVRKALGWRYVFGMTVSRGAMAVWLIWYQKGDWVFLWESNDDDIIWGWILLGWLWFQVSVLIAQEIFGPRFFISGNLLPPTYNYFAPHVNDEESEPFDGKRHDCAICMQSIEIPTLPVSGGGGDTVALSANVLGRKVARTPCGHVFHTTCLEQWMRIKLACPICRLSLPPL